MWDYLFYGLFIIVKYLFLFYDSMPAKYFGGHYFYVKICFLNIILYFCQNYVKFNIIFIMKLAKAFFTKSKEEQISYLLEKYSCTEIASYLVETLNAPAKTNVPKIRISAEELENHFHIIKKRS